MPGAFKRVDPNLNPESGSIEGATCCPNLNRVGIDIGDSSTSLESDFAGLGELLLMHLSIEGKFVALQAPQVQLATRRKSTFQGVLIFGFCLERRRLFTDWSSSLTCHALYT